jgi:hypothetical protein
MGTTLTGLTPATTYDALIKVGDNGPLSATAKYVGDGLGNDSVVALSTSSVGIGTTSPTQLLHVAGNVRITGALYDGNNAAGTSGQILSSTGTGTDWVSKSDLSLVDGSGTANYVSKWSDTDTLTNSIIYDNGSAVGIGTSSPNRLLTIKNSSDGANGLSFQSYASTSELGYIRYEQTNDILDIANTSGFASGGLKFSTSNTERMRITSAGNVGIGTASPAAKLHVDGAFGTSSGAYISGSTYGMLGVNRGASNASAGVQYYNIGSQKWFAGIYENTDNFGFYSVGTSSFPMVIEYSTGNVGIGTSSPAGNLHIASATDTGIRIQAGASSLSYIDLADTASGAPAGSIAYNHIVDALTFATGGSNTERMRITTTGNVGIGTSSPASKLDVNGDIATSGDIILTGAKGIYFDNAGSKYLDDYEVGTWTMGVTFGGESTGVTYNFNSGTYTKIGRQVTVNGLVQLSNKGSSTGGVRITGLPFNVANTNGNYSQSSLRVKNISFLNAYQGYAEINTTTIVLEQVTNLGVVTAITDTDFVNNSEMIISLTYFV